MKKPILLEDRPPIDSKLMLFALPLAVAVLAGVTIGVIFW